MKEIFENYISPECLISKAYKYALNLNSNHYKLNWKKEMIDQNILKDSEYTKLLNIIY